MRNVKFDASNLGFQNWLKSAAPGVVVLDLKVVRKGRRQSGASRTCCAFVTVGSRESVAQLIDAIRGKTSPYTSGPLQCEPAVPRIKVLADAGLHIMFVLSLQVSWRKSVFQHCAAQGPG